MQKGDGHSGRGHGAALTYPVLGARIGCLVNGLQAAVRQNCFHEGLCEALGRRKSASGSRWQRMAGREGKSHSLFLYTAGHDTSKAFTVNSTDRGRREI